MFLLFLVQHHILIPLAFLLEDLSLCCLHAFVSFISTKAYVISDFIIFHQIWPVTFSDISISLSKQRNFVYTFFFLPFFSHFLSICPFLSLVNSSFLPLFRFIFPVIFIVHILRIRSSVFFRFRIINFYKINIQ